MKLRRFFWQMLTAFSILIICTYTPIIFLQHYIESNLLVYILCLFISLAASVYLSFRMSRPVENLLERVELVASGDLDAVVDLSRNETTEIHDIAIAMDAIADQLNSKIDFIKQQKEEQESILQSLTEGLVAIDSTRQITHVNPAALKIFKDFPKFAVGKKIEEVIRHPEMQSLVIGSLKERVPLEGDIEFLGPTNRYLRVHTSPLIGFDKKFSGLVLVVNDVTRMRQLEGMRKNFVANVSHELRTPLTSIQGFAETLMNPNVKDPAEIRKFIEIIQRHATRLSRIIEDILSLSRIERDAEKQEIDKKPESVKTIVKAVIELCQVKAQKKNTELKLSMTDDVEVLCDRYLIEQALINLVDNAIRYSDESSLVTVDVHTDGAEVLINIIDNGVGIAENQLGKVFERFYRVDRARSRELGGTGLGLSIVKHIALAHKGRVEVKSQIGKGSTFSLHLPKVAAPS